MRGGQEWGFQEAVRLDKMTMLIGKARTFPARGLGVVFCLFLFFLLSLPGAAGAYQVVHEKITVEPVAAGVKLEKFMQQTNEGPLKIYVLHVDLTNPYVKIDVLVGADNKSFGQVIPVLEMARRSQAVAALNGDFFHLKEGRHPLGFTVKQGRVLTSPMLRDDFYAFALTEDLRPHVEVFSFRGVVEAENGATFYLAGINKPRYTVKEKGVGEISDKDRLYLYDSAWGPVSRGTQADLSGWVEVVVDQGFVQEVRVDQAGAAIPEKGFVLAGHGPAAQFLLENCKPETRVSVSYSYTPLEGKVQTAVGGQALLVENGQRVPFFSQNIKGKFARSAVGFSRDGRKLYLVGVEGGKESRGMFQEELADFLIERLGIWRALNLDGGGSTSLAARPLGEELPLLLNNPAQGLPRPVPNALTVFTTAPPGQLRGLVIQGPGEVLAGLSYSFAVRGYDEYYNPYSVVQDRVSWSVRQGSGFFEGNRYKAEKGGSVVLEAAYGGFQQEFTVRVVGPADLAVLEVIPGEIKLDLGEEASLRVRVRGKDGRVWEVPFQEVRWELSGPIGQLQDGKFRAGAEDIKGEIKAHFLGFTVEIPVTVGVPLPSDVRDHWAKAPVKELLVRGVVRGYPDGTFRPEQAVTRAELVTILARVLNWTVSGEVDLPFKDETPSWALSSLAAAWSRGVIGGYPDATFRPDRAVSRAEMAVLITRALELPGARDPVAFRDAGQIPGWAQEAVQRAAAAGIVQGSGGYFRPLAIATRAETAALIYQSLLYSKL